MILSRYHSVTIPLPSHYLSVTFPLPILDGVIHSPSSSFTVPHCLSLSLTLPHRSQDGEGRWRMVSGGSVTMMDGRSITMGHDDLKMLTVTGQNHNSYSKNKFIDDYF